MEACPIIFIYLSYGAEEKRFTLNSIRNYVKNSPVGTMKLGMFYKAVSAY